MVARPPHMDLKTITWICCGSKFRWVKQGSSRKRYWLYDESVNRSTKKKIPICFPRELQWLRL
jgi:hypothetical protein